MNWNSTGINYLVSGRSQSGSRDYIIYFNKEDFVYPKLLLTEKKEENTKVITLGSSYHP